MKELNNYSWAFNKTLLKSGAKSIRRLPSNIDFLPQYWQEMFQRIRIQQEPPIWMLEGDSLTINLDGAIWDERGNLHLSHHEYSESRVIADRLNLKPIFSEWATRPKFAAGKLLRHFKNKQINTLTKQLPGDLNALYFSDNRAQSNFYHWFVDAMVRLLVAGPLIRDSLLLLSESQMGSRYVMESLKMIGFSKDQLVQMTSQCSYRTENLRLITGAIYATGACSTSGIRMLRQQFLVSGVAKHRIYLARKASLGRRIENEAGFSEILKKFGIRTIYPEDMALPELIELLGKTELLIGVYGAALTHVIFLPKNSAIFEVAPSQFISHTPEYWGKNYPARYSGDYFYSLSEASEINYYLIPCKRTDENVYLLNANLIVDLDILLKTLVLL